jgi:hypothetical protein
MSAGLFALSCPICGAELKVNHRAVGLCFSCQKSYLVRFGHLIPTDPTGTAEPAALIAEG